MATPYTFNQIGALVTMLAAAVWFDIFLDMDMVIQQTKVQPWSTEVLYMELIVWIFVLLYAIRFKWSYIVGIVCSIYILFFNFFFLFRSYSEQGQWLKSTGTIDSVLLVLLYIAILCLYFSYRSYKELIFSLNPIDISTA